MKNKLCRGCSQILAASSFYRHKLTSDGLRDKCKSCTAKINLNWQRRNRAKLNEDARRRYAENPALMLSYVRRWQKDNPEKKRANARVQHKKHHLKFPQKRKAVQAVNNAIRDGRLFRVPCEVCRKLHGRETQAEAHHNDYLRQLDVVWLCNSHHRAWHRVFVAENA